MSKKKIDIKSKKITYKKAKVDKSVAIRAIQKTEKLIAGSQEKLTKQFTKYIRSTDKMIAMLTAQLGKVHHRKNSDAPVRGRKPAKNAVKLLEAALESAKSEKTFLKGEQEKFNAQQKAIFIFLKEWKKNLTASTKSKVEKTKTSEITKTPKKIKKTKNKELSSSTI